MATTIAIRICATALLMTGLLACGSRNDTPTDEEEMFDPHTTAMTQTFTDDLSHYELVGPVKSCRRTTYFDVVRADGELVPDTSGINRVESTAYFDQIGGYVPKSNERIRRDRDGRIIRWEDRRPNVGSIHPGFLKDTLAYEYVDRNQKVANGMGGTTVVVTDDLGNILSQQIISRNPRHTTLASNIYRKYDRRGNWTERLTVWTTRTSWDSLPSVHYSIDRRKINYYPQ